MRVKVRLAAAVLLAGVTLWGMTRLLGQTPEILDSRVETVATLPSAGATENICQTTDGLIYVTGFDDHALWTIRPGGMVDKFATISNTTAVLGVAASTNGVVITAFTKPFRGRQLAGGQTPAAGGGAPAAPALDLSDVGSEVIVLDREGHTTAVIPGEKGQAFNGIASAGNGLYLIADSNASTVWRFDPTKKRIDAWLKDAVFAPTTTALIGANGIKVHDDWVYVSVTSRNAIYRVRMDSHGQPQGPVVMFTQGVRADDFDVAKDGSMFVPVGTVMYKISPAGEIGRFLENVPNGAAALVSRDGKWLYWPTRGGSAPQRLLRVALE